MPLLVVTLIICGYIAVVALLLGYVVVYIAPRARLAGANPALDLEYRAREYLLREAREPRKEHLGTVDPVCGRDATLDGLHSSVYRGRLYYFCSEDCRDRFAHRPQAYLSAGGAPRVRSQRSFAYFR